jgi:hypothetical protein
MAAVGRIGEEAVDEEPRSWLAALGRAGLVARAIVYLVLSVLAFLIVAHGRSPSNASGTGALAEVGKQPAGPFLLALLAAGVIAYGLWRFLQAVLGLEPAAADRPSLWRRLGWLVIAIAYGTLFAQAISILLGSGTSNASSHPQGYVARILSLPGGPEWVGLLASALAIGGITLCLWGLAHDYERVFDKRRLGRRKLVLIKALGMAGNIARGGLLMLVSSYLFFSAISDRSSKAKSLDQALQSLARQQTGPIWIALGATGLVAYAAYSAFEARYRRI